MRLQNSSHDGVGPEALCGTVLGLHLLGFRSRVWVTGIQHGLEDTPTGVDEPARTRKRTSDVQEGIHILIFREVKTDIGYHQS